MQIGYLGATVGHDRGERERRRRIVSELVAGALGVEFLYARGGPAAIDTSADERAAVGPIVALATRHQARFDAFIITCFGDVGIHALRRAVEIPVIAPARATYAMAAATYPRFAILALNDGFIDEEIALLDRMGIRSAVTHIAAVNMKALDIAGQPEQALARMRATAATIDAAAIVPGCMSMAYLLEERGIRELAGCRVVNPLRCGIRLATALVA